MITEDLEQFIAQEIERLKGVYRKNYKKPRPNDIELKQSEYLRGQVDAYKKVLDMLEEE